MKGWTLGPDIEGRNATHQIKKMTKDQLLALRDRLYLHDEIPESALDGDLPPYFRPAEDSVEYQYMMERRRALGGSIPKRSTRARQPLPLPSTTRRSPSCAGSGEPGRQHHHGLHPAAAQPVPRRDFGQHVVPIIPDEARTFGMDSLFRELKIYASQGQKYEPVDHDLLLSYTEATNGQILEEGITEAGSMASFIAAGTQLRHPWRADRALLHLLFDVRLPARRRPHLAGGRRPRPRLPDGRHRRPHHAARRGPAAPGRPLARAGHARCRRARPTTRRSPTRWRRSSRPASTACTARRRPRTSSTTSPSTTRTTRCRRCPTRDGIERRDRPRPVPVGGGRPRTTASGRPLLFSGSAQGAARAAAAELAEHYDVGVELWSATSYKALREDALATERWNRLHPGQPATTAARHRAAGRRARADRRRHRLHEDRARAGRPLPARPQLHRRSAPTAWVAPTPARRCAATSRSTPATSWWPCSSALAAEGEVKPEMVADAIARYGIDPDAASPIHG